MQIRDATPHDFEAIVRLVPTREELFLVYPRGRHPFTVEQLAELAAVRSDFTVAVREGEIVGFSNFYDLKPDQWVFIGNVVVSRAARGQGLGRRLVTHMAEKAFAKYGLPEVRLSVFSDNLPALLLYASLGFTPFALEERRDPAGKRVALIHMHLLRNKA